VNQKVPSKKMMSDAERVDANKIPKGSGINAADPAGASVGEKNTTPKAMNSARKRLCHLVFLSGKKMRANSALPSINSAIDKKPTSETQEAIGNCPYERKAS
jgi:hypothetical protein